MQAWPLAGDAHPEDRLRPGARRPRAAHLASSLAAGRSPLLSVDPATDGSLTDLSRNARSLAQPDDPGARPDAVLVSDVAPVTAVLRAAAYRDAGIDVWCRVSSHDRNRVAVEGDLAALADLDVAAVVVDTEPVPGRVRDLTPLDCVRLAAYAGHLVVLDHVDHDVDQDVEPVWQEAVWQEAGATAVLRGLRAVALGGHP